NSIHLKKRNFRNETILEWTVNDDENAAYYLIEYSNKSNLFEPVDTVLSIKNKGQLTYKKTLMKMRKDVAFYRVSGVDLDEKQYHSNIVHTLSVAGRTGIYPNPSRDKLYIKTNQKITRVLILYPNGRTHSILPMQDAQGDYISISSLEIGTYFLRIQSTNGLETIAFIKQ
ncbi:MAG: hypothetical protein RLZZ520_485, partial [Bacteroidota bacterium]